MTDQDNPRPPRSGWRTVLILLVVALAVLAAGFYFTVLPGLSVARQEPSKLEVAIATFLLHHSVPAGEAAKTNPLAAHPDAADIAAGRELYTAKCEACHAYDGGGKTEIGSGTFPRPPVLKVALTSMSDGEIFYHIRNGIRNTAMPAWNFPDRQDVAAGELSAPSAHRGGARAAGYLRPADRGRERRPLCRLQGLPELPPGDLCALVQDGAWPMSSAIPRCIPMRFADLTRPPRPTS